MSSRRLLILIAVLGLITMGIFVAPAPQADAANTIQGLHVAGNKILNSAGQVMHLYGVNRSGFDYACDQGWGMSDGPVDAASVAAIASWHVNIVRIPVNEDCWLGINGVAAAYAGANYQQAIVAFVNLLNSSGIAAIIDLQINAPGTTLAARLNPMPDQDHSPAFWQSVATTFKGNTSVLFDLFNEPYPDNNTDSVAGWTCWKNGGTCSGVPYQAAGMQELVTTVRSTGAANIIMIGGLNYSNSLTQWLTYRPTDPTGNLVASWHVYDFTNCITVSCWNSTIAPVMAQAPVITGELGESDCAHGFIDPLMAWLDSQGGSYLAWAWDAWPNMCSSGPTLITDYTGAPTGYGLGFKNHLAALASGGATATPAIGATATLASDKTVTPMSTFSLTPSITTTLMLTPSKAITPTYTPSRAATLPPSPTNPPGVISIDDSITGSGVNQFNYVGSGWSHCASCNEPTPAIYYNASQSWDSTTNDNVTLAFTGTQVKYYAVAGPWHGIAELSIDNKVIANVDLYGATKTGNVLFWSSPVLAFGAHTLKIRATGNKNAASTGTTITLDRVDVVINPPTPTPNFTPVFTKTSVPPTPTPNFTPVFTKTSVPPTQTPTLVLVVNTTIVDDATSGTGQNQFNYVGSGWSHCANCNETAPVVTFYNTSQSWNDTLNDSVTLAFTGTQIKYYAVVGPWHGIAEVSIDGKVAANVDLYGTAKIGNALVWSSAPLTAGAHTLKIRAIASKNAASTGTTITLDRVVITG